MSFAVFHHLFEHKVRGRSTRWDRLLGLLSLLRLYLVDQFIKSGNVVKECLIERRSFIKMLEESWDIFDCRPQKLKSFELFNLFFRFPAR